MGRPKRPKVDLRCVASHYAGPAERIMEFSHENGGGLIGITATVDGKLFVDVYRYDPTVEVRIGKPGQ